jgi:hypothetical protein
VLTIAPTTDLKNPQVLTFSAKEFASLLKTETSEIAKDRLYGVRLVITGKAQGAPSFTATTYVYRYLDVADERWCRKFGQVNK